MINAAVLVLPLWMDGYPFDVVVVAGVWASAVIVSWTLYHPIFIMFGYFVFYNVAIPLHTGHTGTPTGLTKKRSNRVGPLALSSSSSSSAAHLGGWGSTSSSIRTEPELSLLDDE